MQDLTQDPGNFYGRDSRRRSSRILRRYEIKSKTVRVGEGTKKGYMSRRFVDAWELYLAYS